MKRSVFRQWFALWLVVFSALVWWASLSIREAAATGKAGSAPVPSNDPAIIATVTTVEREMGDAMVAVDIDKLNQIFADD